MFSVIVWFCVILWFVIFILHLYVTYVIVCILFFFFFFFFFFKQKTAYEIALVTGVQTCALPILESADQPPSRGQDLPAVDRDRDLAALGRLAVGIERDEFQAQIVLLHHPAVGLDAELDRGRIERDLLRGGERLAVRVLIIHLDPHARGAIEARRHVDRAACGAVGAQRQRDRLRRRQRARGLLAIGVERLDAFRDLLAAETVGVIALRRGHGVEPADPQADRQSRCAAARKIADEQVQRQDRKSTRMNSSH